MPSELIHHLSVTSRRRLPGGGECRQRLEAFLLDAPDPAAAFESLAAEARRSGGSPGPGRHSRTIRVRSGTRRQLNALAARSGIPACLLIRHAVHRRPAGESGRESRADAHAEAASPRSPAAAAGDEAASAEARIPGTAVVRRDGDRVLVKTPRWSASFAKAIRGRGGGWDSKAYHWYAPASFADEVEAMARRCFENVEVRTG